MRITSIILFAILIVACKKQSQTIIQPTTQTQTTPTNSYPNYNKGKITVSVQSNYQYPYMAIEQGQVTLKRINETPSTFTMLAAYSYSFQANTIGTYRIYCLSQEVAKYKSDTAKVWQTIQVFYNDTVLMLSTPMQQQAVFYFNIK